MKKYRNFFLKPILLVCLGLVFSTVVVAQMLLSRTDAPGMPMIVDLSSTGCAIAYTAPKNDGGLPTFTYIIEGRKKGKRDWTLEAATSELTYRVTGRKVGDQEEFRVYAQNAAGLNFPSKPSFMVTYEDR